MATKVIMPALGMAQDSGILIRWLKNEGEQITEGEPLMEIETDKVTVEIDAPASGILASVTAEAGAEVPVGQVIAWILAPGESAPVPEVAASPVAVRIAAEHNVDLSQIKTESSRINKADILAYIESGQDSAGAGHIAPAQTARRRPASPKARRLAREQGLELASITGSGPNGAVLAADVLTSRASETVARGQKAESLSSPDGFIAPSPGSETLSISKTWQVMAERLSQSWHSVPHFYLLHEVEASRFIAWRQIAKKRSAEKITYTDLLVKITAAALRKHPRLNASWHEGAIKLNNDINIGLAVAVAEGLVVPVIHRADRLTLAELAARRAEIVGRAGEGKLQLADVQGGTFTISNLGMYGIDAFSAIVNPPQAAILAVGRIADRVVPVNGQPAVRPMMAVSLSADHRLVDGARAAQFLDTLVSLIEEPMGLIE